MYWQFRSGRIVCQLPRFGEMGERADDARWSFGNLHSAAPLQPYSMAKIIPLTILQDWQNTIPRIVPFRVRMIFINERARTQVSIKKGIFFWIFLVYYTKLVSFYTNFVSFSRLIS